MEARQRDPDRPPATIDHVALAAGVSRSTAARVLSGNGSVSDRTRARVRAAARHLGYVPNPVARALARGDAGTRIVLAVTAPDTAPEQDSYLGRLVAGAAEACHHAGAGVGLERLHPDAPARTLERLARDRGVRGVVLVGSTPPLLAAVPARLRGRVVAIGLGDDRVPSYDVAKGAATSELTAHLVATGHRRIAFVAGPATMPCTAAAADGYRRVLREAALPELVLPGGFEPVHGRAGALAALRHWPGLDAVLASCDAAAFGALSELRRLGIDVPGDVAVAGFDDVRFAALSSPALTTARHPVEQIAAAATGAFLDGNVPGRSMFDAPVVLRESA